MKALISTLETSQTGFRVAQVEADASVFPVAEALFWVDCSDDVVADQFWYDPTTQTIKPVPEFGPKDQPTSQGAQTL